MVSHTLFVEQLEKVRLTFDDDTYPLPKHQHTAFQLCSELLSEDDVSLASRSKQRRSVRSRARTLLIHVLEGLGSELFFICTLATSISTLATVVLDGLLSLLRQWWEGVPHPRGLTIHATRLCEAGVIKALANEGPEEAEGE